VGFVCGDGIYCALLLMVMRCDERRKMSRLFAKGENRKMWKKVTKYTIKEKKVCFCISLYTIERNREGQKETNRRRANMKRYHV